VGYQYTGYRYSPNSATYSDEQIKLEAYHLVDTQLAYKISSSTDCRVGIKNILDETYEWKYGYPAEGRSYYVSLEWKL
jgi:outer membrane cobalamin receptor